MHILSNVDLATDSAARRYVKVETVDVVFAQDDAAVVSREGLNRYQRGDAIITGSTADRWSVTRERFDARYEPVPPLVHGGAGRYRSRPIPVLAKQMLEPFTVARTTGGDMLEGNAGDWLMQYAPGDYGVVEGAKFQRVYRELG